MKPWCVILPVVLVAACSGGAADTRDGARLFAEKCAMCHGPEGKPTADLVARINVRDLTAPEFRARVTPALVEHQVGTGSQNKLMPSFAGLLDDAQIRAVAAYVASPKFPRQ